MASGDPRDSANRMCWPAQAGREARLSAAVEADRALQARAALAAAPGIEAALCSTTAGGGPLYDAICSLAVLDDAGAPVTVSPDGEAEQNVIVWMDRRRRRTGVADR